MGHDYYTDDKGTLVLMALLKEYGIKKVVAHRVQGIWL